MARYCPAPDDQDIAGYGENDNLITNRKVVLSLLLGFSEAMQRHLPRVGHYTSNMNHERTS